MNSISEKDQSLLTHYAQRWSVSQAALAEDLRVDDLDDDRQFELLEYIDSALHSLAAWSPAFVASAFWQVDLSGDGSFAARLGKDLHHSVLQEVEEFLFCAIGPHSSVLERAN